jgi:hypothetical protein
MVHYRLSNVWQFEGRSLRTWQHNTQTRKRSIQPGNVPLKLSNVPHKPGNVHATRQRFAQTKQCTPYTWQRFTQTRIRATQLSNVPHTPTPPQRFAQTKKCSLNCFTLLEHINN